MTLMTQIISKYSIQNDISLTGHRKFSKFKPKECDISKEHTISIIISSSCLVKINQF